MLVGLHVPTNFQMYRQNTEKALLGGNCPPCPPPPFGYANVMMIMIGVPRRGGGVLGAVFLIAETGKNYVIFTSFYGRVRRLIYVIFERL